MGDGEDKHKSPKGKKGVINRIGDVVQTFSPRSYRTKVKSKKSSFHGVAQKDTDDHQQVQTDGSASPTHVAVDLTGVNLQAGLTKHNSDEKTDEFKFFYERDGASGEFSSPFTSQFDDH